MSQYLISIVDDDEAFREAMTSLMKSLGFEVEAFSSAEDFLASPRLGNTSCLIADVHMPGMTGIELQQQLVASGAVSCRLLFWDSVFDSPRLQDTEKVRY